MSFKLRSVLGEVVLKNGLGWHVVRYRRGYAVRPPLSFKGLLASSGPGLLNLALILKYWLFNAELLTAGFLAIPFTMFFGFYVLRDTALYINTDMNILICENLFDRRFFGSVSLSVDEENCLVRMKSKDGRTNVVVWKAESISGAEEACSALQGIMDPASQSCETAGGSARQKGFGAWIASLLRAK